MDDDVQAKAEQLAAACKDIAANEIVEPVDMDGALKAIGVIGVAVARLARMGVMPELTRGDPLSEQTHEDINKAIQVGLVSLRFLFDYVASEDAV